LRPMSTRGGGCCRVVQVGRRRGGFLGFGRGGHGWFSPGEGDELDARKGLVRRGMAAREPRVGRGDVHGLKFGRRWQKPASGAERLVRRSGSCGAWGRVEGQEAGRCTMPRKGTARSRIRRPLRRGGSTCRLGRRGRPVPAAARWSRTARGRSRCRCQRGRGPMPFARTARRPPTRSRRRDPTPSRRRLADARGPR